MQINYVTMNKCQINFELTRAVNLSRKINVRDLGFLKCLFERNLDELKLSSAGAKDARFKLSSDIFLLITSIIIITISSWKLCQT